jgi:hypothetical protein
MLKLVIVLCEQISEPDCSHNAQIALRDIPDKLCDCFKVPLLEYSHDCFPLEA